MIRRVKRPGSLWWLVGICLFVVSVGYAAGYPPPPGPDDKPFADARIVLQLSDGEASVQARVLNVANNLLKHYGGPERVDLEIVAFGPGISLLFADGEQRDRVSSLAASGVRLIACMNTVDTIERTTGRRPELVAAAIPVQAGVAHIVERSGQGYVLVRP
jgi:intracellular sulfur oxidation DsrE/DsrF family protein